MNKLKILILEDEKKRVSFLKHALKSRNLFKSVDIVWAISVEEFETLIKFNNFDLIILDHDLGDSIFDLNGANAASLLTDSNVPVIIWSVNFDGAKRIESILNSKNIVSRKLPFSKTNANVVCQIIAHLV